jgi:selenocysteine-specific translation elongation factor
LLVDDAFALKQAGKVVVVGVVAEGEVRPGAQLLLRAGAGELQVTAEALEASHLPLHVARQGDRIGILLVGATKEQITAGTILVSNAE